MLTRGLEPSVDERGVEHPGGDVLQLVARRLQQARLEGTLRE